MLKKIILYTAVVFLFACVKSEVPDHMLSQEQMVGILTHIHLEESRVQQKRIAADTAISVFHHRAREIYARYDTDSATFRNSFNYYLQQPPLLDAIYEAVTDSIGLRQSLKKMD